MGWIYLMVYLDRGESFTNGATLSSFAEVIFLTKCIQGCVRNCGLQGFHSPLEQNLEHT